MASTTSKGRILKKPSKLSEVEPRTNQVTSTKQWEVLVGWLERHPTIATCTFITNSSKRDIARRLWNDISVVLNNLEAAYHSTDKWKRVWKDMKHKVKSKLEHNSRKKKKADMMRLTAYEQRVANILEHKNVRSKLKTKLSDEENSDEHMHDDTTIELEIHDNNALKDDNNVYEPNLSSSQYQPIENTDTQEESQMSIAKSLQQIRQQKIEILYFIRKTYNLQVEDFKKRQTYRSAKLDIYRRKLEIMQTQLEMDKFAYS